MNNVNNLANIQIIKKKHTVWLWIFIALGVLFWVGIGYWYVALPKHVRNMDAVNAVSSEINPGQFGKVVRDESIQPSNDQNPQRIISVLSDSSPIDLDAKAMEHMKNMGFKNYGGNSFDKFGSAQWRGNIKEKHVQIFINIYGPDFVYNSTNDKVDANQSLAEFVISSD